MAERREGRGLAVLGAFLLAAAVGIVRPGVASAVDFTPPACTSVGQSGSNLQVTFQDTGSGLDSITTLENVNGMVTIPSFTSGTTSAVAVTVAPVSAGQATVRLKATDVDGNTVDCGRITFENEALTQGGKLSDALTDIQQSQTTLKFLNGTPGFTRLRVTVGRFRPRITLTDGQQATVSLSGQLVAGSNTISLALNGMAPASGFALVQSAATTTVACPEDATRTTFAGGPFAGACRQFTGNQASCDLAYHLTQLGEPSSCFWDAANSECIGCGPGGGRGNSLGCTNTCLPAPTDPCTSPGTVPAAGGIVTGTLTGSSGTTNGTCDETNGPEAAFAWTPNFTGGARITTCGDTDFGNAVYVREATCSSGTELACNRGMCTNGGRVELNVTSGTTYYIFVDGSFGASGNFQLSVNGPITCPSDPTRVFVGGPFTGFAPGACHKFDGAETACNGSFHTSFFGAPASCIYDTGTNKCNGCAGPSEGFRSVTCTNTCLPAPTCPGDASRTTFAGGPFTQACQDIGNDQTTCEDAFHLTFGYQPAACVFDGGCFGCGPHNELQFDACTDTCLTATDPCTSPTVIPAAGGVFTGTTSGKGSETGTCNNTTGPEKAFEWTPSTSGTATIDTCGGTTDFATVLYMREATCGSGTENACNQGACFNSFGDNEGSRITPTVTAGTTYYIFVDGEFGSAGNFTLRVTAPED